MNCRDCEELIAAAARDGQTLEAAAEHIAHCGRCREFAQDAAAVALSLAGWRAPGALQQGADAAYAALLRQTASPARREGERRGLTAAGGPGLKPRSVPDESRHRGLGRETHGGGFRLGTGRGFNPGSWELRQPALLALPGVALAAAGLAAAPAWVKMAAACWVVVSTALVSVVMLSHARTAASGGEWG